MKILYVCHETLPSPHTSTEQIVKTAAALADLGLETHVICPTRANHGDGSPASVASFYGISRGPMENGLRFLQRRVPAAIRGNAARPWHDIGAAIYAHASDYDVVYTRDPFSLFTALLAHDRVVFETYRLDLNIRRRHIPWRTFCYRNANLKGVVAHSRIARASLLRAGLESRRVLVAYNGFSPELMRPRLSKAEARRSLGLPIEGTLVTYTGHVDQRKGLEVLLPIAKALPWVQFLLLGHVPGSEAWFTRRKALEGVQNLSLRERVPPSEVVPYLYAADCLLIPPSARPLRNHQRTVLPMKTFPYLAAGRPVLAPDLPDHREVLHHEHNAVLVAPDSPQTAVEALDTLLRDGPRQERLSKNALSSSTEYTWEARAHKIATFLDGVLAGR